MTKRCQTWMFLTLLAFLSGCGSRGNTDLLEARLRDREDQLYQANSDLSKANSDLEVAQRKNTLLHNQLANKDGTPVFPEQSDSLVRARGIRIQKWMTGGIDRDDIPGDDLLTAVITPQDDDGETVKLPGRIQLRLLDPKKPKDQQQIGEWTFQTNESRKNWHSGVITSGYQFELPWQEPPESSELTLHATFQTTDGRTFETSEIIRVTPPIGSMTQSRSGSNNPFAENADNILEVSSSTEIQPVPFPEVQPNLKPQESFESFFNEQPKTNGHKLKPLDSTPRLRTSDNWTDETIPRLR